MLMVGWTGIDPINTGFVVSTSDGDVKNGHGSNSPSSVNGSANKIKTQINAIYKLCQT